MENKKMKAFVNHILEECEREGFTMNEVSRIPQMMRQEINNSNNEQNEKIPFRIARVQK